ncbi:MAG: DUF2769 domain-containing protein [Candidatus Lokiarchaeota archaeon]|nr:DUF2769 domain-containing protein [Candidatus Lokiarchaeota archaeon]
MPKKVPDNEENVNICKKFCGSCPTFKTNDLKKMEPHVLFCSRGPSKKSKEKIEEKGCNCFKCGVFSKYNLEGGWFCIYGIEGKK